jgi:hypothetical protein
VLSLIAPRGPNEGGDEASSEIHLSSERLCKYEATKKAQKAQNVFLGFCAFCAFLWLSSMFYVGVR